ncbi:hypothetical protein FOCC_FOCC016686 [Frankliniella occidentalis]|nr:hypothetical protein FOCC_FOCC016686 [Frankliniella occidentalis]
MVCLFKINIQAHPDEVPYASSHLSVRKCLPEGISLGWFPIGDDLCRRSQALFLQEFQNCSISGLIHGTHEGHCHWKNLNHMKTNMQSQQLVITQVSMFWGVENISHMAEAGHFALRKIPSPAIAHRIPNGRKADIVFCGLVKTIRLKFILKRLVSSSMRASSSISKGGKRLHDMDDIEDTHNGREIVVRGKRKVTESTTKRMRQDEIIPRAMIKKIAMYYRSQNLKLL